jgi:hypothetical protein
MITDLPADTKIVKNIVSISDYTWLTVAVNDINQRDFTIFFVLMQQYEHYLRKTDSLVS